MKSKLKACWVLQNTAPPFTTYMDIQQMYANTTSHLFYTVLPDHALIFKTKELAEAFKKQFKGNGSQAVKIMIDIAANKAAHEKFRTEQEELKRLIAETEDRLRKEQQAWDESYNNETLRLANLSCPCCKAQKPIHRTIRQQVSTRDVVVGGRVRSNPALIDFYQCQKCGVHFTDVNKAELGERPGGRTAFDSYTSLAATLATDGAIGIF